MANEDTNFLEELLDQHDYELPEVGDIRKGVIVAITQQGVIVDLGLKRDGIVPSSDLSKLEPEEREALQVNDELAVYVLNTEAPDSLVVSIHLAQMNQDWIEAEQLLESGDIIQGEVIGYNKGGAIVPYGRLRGFVPASHLTELTRGMSDRQRQQRLAKLRGENLPLKVIEVDRRRRRLVFSQREAQKEWEEIRRRELLEKLNEGDIISGRVSGLRDFGIFVDLGGADGLVHISELAWHRIDHPREVVKAGDEIDVYVLKVDAAGQRISLSRKRLLPNPWSTVEEKYSLNQLVEGKITRIVDYGAFAELEPGIEGLLHVSQLSRGSVENVQDVVKEGETHLLRVVSIDQERQRIGLSLKAVTAQEQIEWMAERELAAQEEATLAETAAAEAAVDEAAEVEQTAAAEADVGETAEVEQTAAEAAVDEAAEVEQTAAEAAIGEAAEVEQTAAAEAAVGETAEVEQAVAEAEAVDTEAVAAAERIAMAVEEEE